MGSPPRWPSYGRPATVQSASGRIARTVLRDNPSIDIAAPGTRRLRIRIRTICTLSRYGADCRGPEADRLGRELAARTAESLTEAILVTLRKGWPVGRGAP